MIIKGMIRLLLRSRLLFIFGRQNKVLIGLKQNIPVLSLADSIVPKPGVYPVLEMIFG